MKAAVILLAFVVLTGSALSARAADDSKVKAATRQVEIGAKKIGDGQVGEGVEETAEGIGYTVVEGAKYSGGKLAESSRVAGPEAKSAWQNVRAGATDFGHSVKNFFARLFRNP